MRRLFKSGTAAVATILCLSYVARADGVPESRTSLSQAFHLLSFKCQPDADDLAESTPQSPPLDVDDADTPGCNQWEINVFVDGDLTSTGKSWQLPLLDMNYGVGDNIELTYDVPFLTQEMNGVSASALGQSLVGVKDMFLDDDSSGTEIALFPQVSFVGAQSAAVQKGLETPGTITTLPIMISQEVGNTPDGPVSVSFNLGYNLSTQAGYPDFLSAAVGLGAPVLPRLSLMGELSTEQSFFRDSTGVRQQLLKTDIGMIKTITTKFFLFGAVGHSLMASDQVDHSYVVGGFRVVAGGM